MASSSMRLSGCVVTRRPWIRRYQQHLRRGGIPNNLSRSLSVSSYEYPNRTELPEVERTTAQEAMVGDAGRRTTTTNTQNRWTDNSGRLQNRLREWSTLSSAEREERKTAIQRKEEWPRSEDHLRGATAITTTIPDHVPPNVPATELAVPETEITRLDNGIRVVSQEMYGQVCTVGVLADVGSRHQGQNYGVAHAWEILAFSSTQQKYASALEVNELLQDWGGTRFVNIGREQALACVDILRPNVPKAMEMLAEVILRPKFHDVEVEEAKQTIFYQMMDLPPELMLESAMQTAAYGVDQQLGRPHLCPPEDLQRIDANVVRDFWNTNVLANPQGMVVAGAGIGHDQLVDLVHKEFGDWPDVSAAASSENRTVPSVYRAGEHRIHHESPMDDFTRVALAFEMGGWHSDDLVAACVLQTLLGGGNSFSAGGPGKGMYSRLYQQVLNRYGWAESAEAFTSIHSENGLWGISGSSTPQKSLEMVQVLAQHVLRLSTDLVKDEEIDRARNMLKCNVLTQLESRLVLFEDLGRQVLTYGSRENIETTCQKIDAVTKEQLRELVRRSLQKPPTLAAVGEQLDRVPPHAQVAAWFR